MGQLIISGTLIQSPLQQIGNFGHLQLVNPDLGQEIEVQPNQDIDIWRDFFLGGNIFPDWDVRPVQGADRIRDPQLWSDPSTIQDVTIDLGDRATQDVWDAILKISDIFRNTSINYTPLQNSNTFINSIMYMIGFDVRGFLSMATPSSVTGPVIL